jgi:hypothetical protein
MKWAAVSLIAKKWATPLLSLLLVAGVAGIWYHGYQTGQDRERLAMMDDLDAARQVQAELADDLEKARAERRVVYRDRVQVVERELDPSGCADIPLPPGMLEALRGNGS